MSLMVEVRSLQVCRAVAKYLVGSLDSTGAFRGLRVPLLARAQVHHRSLVFQPPCHLKMKEVLLHYQPSITPTPP